MKKIILFVLVLGALSFQINAQNSVTLNINHKLGDADFAMNQAAKNNIDHDFKVTRLEYYISEISLIHDGGNETQIEDVWILANASTKTEVDLGEHNITSVEKIILHVGVDPDHNHLDPSSYQGSHPLAPKSPSMHWGWTAGYRFIAYEGHGGVNLNQLFQLHGLGDNNYFTTEVELDATADNNALSINLDADYTRALENVSVNSGVIVHGDNLEAKQCLENFRDFVFSPASITSSTINFSEVSEFNIFPNPVVNSISTIKLDLEESGNEYDLTVTSIDGKQLQIQHDVLDGQTIDFSNQVSGMYFVNLIKEGQTIITKKIFVK